MNWVVPFLLLAAAAGGYLAWVFVPEWVLHYEVKQVVREMGNRAVHDANDRALVEALVERVRSLRTLASTDEAGRPVQVPAVPLEVRDVTWERTADPARLHVSFAYLRQVELPLLHRELERTYLVDLDMDVSRPVWASPR